MCGEWLAGEELVWEARVVLPVAGKFLYKYVVVDEAGQVAAEEAEARLLDVSENLREGSVVQICDTWQVCPASQTPNTSASLSVLQSWPTCPNGPQSGPCAQDASNPNALLARSAFSEVILAQKSRVEGCQAPQPATHPDHIILRLQCW